MKNKLFCKSFLAIFLFSVFACNTAGGGGNQNQCSEGMSLNEAGECVPGIEPGPGPNNNSSSSEGNISTRYGTLPTNQNAGVIQEMYNKWINTFYTTYEDDLAKGLFNPDVAIGKPGTARIKATYDGKNTGDYTCSEAIGYGMILTSLMEDWDKFNKLLAYSKSFRVSGTALMRWDVNNFLGSNGGSATDADIDILGSLLIAYKKTGNQNYLTDALEIGESIYNMEVDASNKLILPAINTDGLIRNRVFYNISYISLPAIKMLAEHDGKWNEVLNANISYMQMVQNAGAGLWPDWSDASGVPVNPCNGSNQCLGGGSLNAQGVCSQANRECAGGLNSYAAYYKETPRIPWRIAWYYHLYGDDRAKAMLDKGVAFLRSKEISGPDGMKNYYAYADGTAGTTAAGARDWASLCALGMGSSDNQAWMNACNEKILNFYSTAINSYYTNSLQLIYAMLFNGKF